MPIRDRTPYRDRDYAELINACRQRSKYRWAALYEARPPHLARGARAFHLPEGVLVLARGPVRHLPELRDLTQHPLRLRVHLLTWDPTRDRLRLQIDRWFVREKTHLIEEMCGSAYWRRAPGGTAPKSVGEVFVSVNRVTRELRSIDTWAYVNPATRIAYDRRARRAVTRWLVGVARMPLPEARRQVRRYLITWTQSRPIMDAARTRTP